MARLLVRAISDGNKVFYWQAYSTIRSGPFRIGIKFSGFAILAVSGIATKSDIHRILVGSHQAKLYLNKIFYSKLTLQIVRFMVLF